MNQYFRYGNKETDYLKKKDKKLAVVIETFGHICRRTDHDIFSSVVRHIIGQQISTKVQDAIWKRTERFLGAVNAETVDAVSADFLKSLGMSFRKAEYIKEFARKVRDRQFVLDELWEMSDEEAISRLKSLRGVGIWTAEMILLFCMERPDILSYDDLALRRGMQIIYHHKIINRPLFEKYRKRYSPYGSVASLYLWAVAGGDKP
ncbi:MAG: DNA-3-methyladenine glycosylase 2 family protein [Phascolarctobacterium sp.]|nr:DNA-3-methyladenine glycosylase 2 family protein [Phascolarctobacterium sp.]